MNIIKPSSPMRSKPTETIELETECLFGEAVEVLDNYLDWAYCKLLTDNYQGWIKKENLGHLEPVTHRVISNRSFLYKDKEVKSGFIHYLPLGAQLPVKKVIKDNWVKIDLTNTNFNNIAFVPKNHIVTIDHIIDDWVSIAEKLIGTPYVWGGRDSIGIDCSALLQLSLQAYGKNIPRNTIDQFNCIHANAFHMETVIEPLKDIELRIGEKFPILKIMNFNNFVK